MKISGGPGGPLPGAARGTLWAVAVVSSFSIATVYGAGSTGGSSSVREASTVSRGSRPVAVVELFTSEACAACPAAEAYFKELMAEARSKGKAVFALAFHVDYWNPPSRRDPLSADAFAQRQRSYAASMRLEGPYTPQMIVNGTNEFVGSDRERAQQSIATALSRAAQVNLDLRARQEDAGSPVQVHFNASALPAGAVLNVAIVERGLSNIVRTGSTAPRRQYENVVRAFRTVALQKSGKLELQPPAAMVSGNSSVIAYAQDPRTGAVLGAAALDLQKPSPVHQAMADEDDGSN